MNETISEFYDRIWVNFKGFGKTEVLVYKSKYQREHTEGIYKPEVWDIKTCKNYIAWLKRKNEN